MKILAYLSKVSAIFRVDRDYLSVHRVLLTIIFVHVKTFHINALMLSIHIYDCNLDEYIYLKISAYLVILYLVALSNLQSDLLY